MGMSDSKEIRKLNIIHVDMDAFYASVEEQDNPRIKGLPIIVGGLSNHGIVTTANYEAREYGIHSAMPIFMEKKKCPKSCSIFPRMKRYQEVSKEVFSILYEFTDLIEQVSIDEAYLDISNISVEPLELVTKIKENVMIGAGLTMSVGVSKPRGQELWLFKWKSLQMY
jgi:DNA polymerase-4